MALNPVLPILFTVSRESLLGCFLPPFQAGDQPTTSTTTCRYRLRWNELRLSNNFEDLVVAYWNTVSLEDRAAYVTSQIIVQDRWQVIANDQRILSEDDIKVSIDLYPSHFHRIAANGQHGAPLPIDDHSSISRCTLGAAQWGLVGVPDFVMHGLNRVTALMEVKNPWLVTPQQIDEVIDSTVRLFLHC
jgi:hypothetical protein